MFTNLPTNPTEFIDWPWEQYAPYLQELLDRPLDQAGLAGWLRDWTAISDRLSESFARINVAHTIDTNDAAAEARYTRFLETILPNAEAAEQKLREKLLASGLELAGYEIPLRQMRTEAALFRSENLPLLVQERKLGSAYNKIIGAQTVNWEGKELTLTQMRPVMQTPDRATREQVWRLASQRQLDDRQGINDLWGQLLDVRQRLAENAGEEDYRAYRWKQMLRLDYTPADALRFQGAILEAAVPAATRVYARLAERLGVERPRPWDLDLDLYPLHFPRLPGYGSTAALQEKAEGIFMRVDPALGAHFAAMRQEKLLDLDNRKGKAPGGYCTYYPVTGRPFIFMNAVGVSGDVRTLLHEAGHAFHRFETLDQPYSELRHPGLEFCEVASMSMELLTAPYMAESQGGFYSDEDARRALREQLEHILVFWPYMAVVDAFQHWVYTNIAEAHRTDACDAKWLELWQRYLPGVDWSGLEDEAMTGWHRKLHIHRYPFYYIEYGVAQLGSVQVWGNALRDQAASVAAYRRALSLGNTAALPELFAAAGGKFAFDAETLGKAVALVESKLQE